MIGTIKKYGDFGRTATRSEFWGVMLSVFALSFLLGILSIVLMIGGVFGMVVAVPVLIAGMLVLTWVSISTIVARCRDAGINPWFTAACFIPYIGTIVMIVIGCLASKK